MKKRAVDKDQGASSSGPSWRVLLASGIFVVWLISSAIILYVSKTDPGVPSENAAQPAPPQKEAAIPFSNPVIEHGKQLIQFHFPPTVAIGRIGTVEPMILGTVHGKTIYSLLEVSHDNINVAQGTVTMPAGGKLSFMPGEMLAVNPSSLTHFRPGEIYDVTMKRVREIDVDVYLEACSQIKGIIRLDLRKCPDLTREGAPFIDDYESLKHLHVNITRRAMPVVARLGALKKVESLGLYSNFDLSPVLANLRASINLKALRLESPVINEENLRTVASLLILDELALVSPIFDKPEAVASTLNIISHCPHLKVLSIETSNIDQPVRLSAEGEKALAACKNLQIMRINKSGNLLSGGGKQR